MSNILYLGVTQFIEEHKKYIDVNSIYRKIPILLKPLRKIWFDCNLPFKKVWLNNDLYKAIQDHEMIILSATQFNFKVLSIIDNYKFQNKRFVFWYWNPVANIVSPDLVSNNWEIWSFDIKDCEKYNLKYNNTYYFEEFTKLVSISPEKKYDVLFIGQDKGRLAVLTKLSELFMKNKLTYYFHVLKDSTSKATYPYKQRISYRQVLELIKSSDLLLDIVQNGQTGLTLRVMEALFFSKKIITNNNEIINYDFYCSQNIFILGVDKNLDQFVRTEYQPIDAHIIKQYTISNWLNNFKILNE